MYRDTLYRLYKQNTLALSLQLTCVSWDCGQGRGFERVYISLKGPQLELCLSV